MLAGRRRCIFHRAPIPQQSSAYTPTTSRLYSIWNVLQKLLSYFKGRRGGRGSEATRHVTRWPRPTYLEPFDLRTSNEGRLVLIRSGDLFSFFVAYYPKELAFNRIGFVYGVTSVWVIAVWSSDNLLFVRVKADNAFWGWQLFGLACTPSLFIGVAPAGSHFY